MRRGSRGKGWAGRLRLAYVGLMSASCLESVPLTFPVPAEVTDVAVLELSSSGEVVGATPFTPYRPEEAFTFRGLGEGPWAVVGYGPVDGLRLTGEVPRTAGSREIGLPDPLLVWIEPGPSGAAPTEILRLTVSPNEDLSCPPTEAKELILSCPEVLAWFPVERGATGCGWTAAALQSAPGIPDELSGQVDPEGRFVPVELEMNGARFECESDTDPFRCEFTDNQLCQVGIQARGVAGPSVPLLGGITSPRRDVSVRCNIVPSARRTVGPLLDLLPGPPGTAIVTNETPAPSSDCRDPVCVPNGRLISFREQGEATEPQVLAERQGRYARLFPVPNDPALVGSLEMRVPSGAVCNPDEGRSPSGTQWQFSLRNRRTLEPVYTSTLAPATAGARARLVVDVQDIADPPMVVALVGDNGDAGNVTALHLIDLATSPPALYVADAQRAADMGPLLSLQTDASDVHIVTENGWLTCSPAMIRANEVSACLERATFPPGVDIIVMSSRVLSEDVRIVGRRGSVAFESVRGEPRQIQIGANGGLPVPTAYLQVGLRLFVAVSEPLMTPDVRILVYDFTTQSFLPETGNLGFGWIHELFGSEMGLRAMNATEGTLQTASTVDVAGGR